MKPLYIFFSFICVFIQALCCVVLSSWLRNIISMQAAQFLNKLFRQMAPLSAAKKLMKIKSVCVRYATAFKLVLPISCIQTGHGLHFSAFKKRAATKRTRNGMRLLFFFRATRNTSRLCHVDGGVCPDSVGCSRSHVRTMAQATSTGLF